ncbi:MAG TPA: 4-hydroxy-3-methylbut-2-enyl diphosphate reductase [Thermoanaerobaculia bacterium]|nr:4-hydroxy-3-methylbut-2-enyl diphosphate reductase [Thermoanaerobaculia bacterium]
MKIKRAENYGFCSGVRIADLKVKRFAAAGGRGAILGQLVHNERVVEEMENLGVRTVDDLAAVEEPTIVFSAHGVPPSFHQRARAAGLKILDTTCKFVYDLHRESKDALAAGYHLVFIGDPKHREVIGYTNDLDPSTYHIVSTVDAARAIDWSRYAKVKVFYQTTLNAEEFEDVVQAIQRSAAIVHRADTICYATKQNQDAARVLAHDPEVDLIIVIGGSKSANTRHLWEICRESKPSYLVQGADDLDAEWFRQTGVVGLTAGASTPEYVIEEVEARIAELASGVSAGVTGARPPADCRPADQSGRPSLQPMQI